MGKKRRVEGAGKSPVAAGGVGVAAKKKKEDPNSSLNSEGDISLKLETSHELEDEEMLTVLPPKEDLQILLDRIESQLPKDDHVKYDSRVRKLDWEQIRFKDFSAEDCKKYWEHIQARIRRFRILTEMIPDARTWLSQPWTNFYKSKDHNRHPEMPKKPLSMYMLYYSERREDIQKDNPNLNMPDVAKICSDEYQKLPEKKKAKFKSRCDEMRQEYDAKLESFYSSYPEMRPIKTEKAAKSAAYKASVVRTAEPERPVILLPGAPQKPGKPFDLFFQQQMEGLNEQTTERGVQLERARQEWRDMKVKKKAKWIRKAMKEFRDYEEKVVEFKSKHPEFNPPSIKSFLTQEEQKILDKHMGRPEKPPSSAYSLFSKEMLNTESIKQFPSKERMSHISEAWKKVSESEKEVYQSQVNDAMSKYKLEYTEWYEALTAEEQKAEKERTTTKSSKKNQGNHIGLLGSTPANSVPPSPSPHTTTTLNLVQTPSTSSPAPHHHPQHQHPHHLQNITVPYPTQPGQSPQPMFVKVEVVGGPQSGHTQLIPQISIPNTATTLGGYGIHQPPGYTFQLPQVTTQQPLQYSQPQPHQHQQQHIQLNQPQHPQQLQQQQPQQLHQPITIQQQVQPQLQPQQQQQQQSWIQVKAEKDRVEGLKLEILRREPVEPARSHKQLFMTDYIKKCKKKDKRITDSKANSEARDFWRQTDKKDKKKWLKMLEPQRQRYIEAYTIFVRGLNKEELELYTEMKARRDAEEEARRANESEDSDDSSSDDDSESESESGSDSDL